MPDAYGNATDEEIYRISYDGFVPPLKAKADAAAEAGAAEYRAAKVRAMQEEERATRRCVAGSRDRYDRARD